MSFTIIVAHSLNGVIGNKGEIPWHLPSDFAFFRQKTEGHTVVMGRKTYESIGRPLPNRRNIVLSRHVHSAQGVECFPRVEDLEESLAGTKGPNEKVFIIGGEAVYNYFIPKASEIYVTLVDAVVKGDTHFPRLDTV